jgi:hypothetical protein
MAFLEIIMSLIAATTNQSKDYRKCGEPCILLSTAILPNRREFWKKFPNYEKIDPRPYYKAYQACAFAQLDAVPIDKSDNDSQIDGKFERAYTKCSISRASGDAKFLPIVIGNRATLNERKIVLNARRGQMIIFTYMENLYKSGLNDNVARLERYMNDLFPKVDT